MSLLSPQCCVDIIFWDSSILKINIEGERIRILQINYVDVDEETILSKFGNGMY